MQHDPTAVAESEEAATNGVAESPGTRTRTGEEAGVATKAAQAARPERLTSIDALRGFDMFWIVGGDAAARELCGWWGTPRAMALQEQFEHVDWQGFRFYDLIFPLFLFLVGVVLPFSLRKYQTEGHPRGDALIRTARRVVLLFLLGLVYNGLLRFHFDTLRIAGVLQRIAVCYGIAAMIYLFTTVRTQAITLVAILAGYWALLTFVPAPESHRAADFSIETNLAGYVDRHALPGKIYKAYYGYGDNEGLLSTIPAVATALLGVLAGRWLLADRNRWLKALGLAAAGGICLGLGLAWGRSFPIIKNLWTSSFVLVAGGWSLLLLALFYTVIDVLRFRAWSTFFVVIGVNAITIYVAHRIVPFDEIAEFLLKGVAEHAGSFGPAVVPLGVIVVEWLFLLHLYRNRIFLRV
ncbi:MAG: acyltransferase family protein [Isosphaeraceae bacterium]